MKTHLILPKPLSNSTVQGLLILHVLTLCTVTTVFAAWYQGAFSVLRKTLE